MHLQKLVTYLLKLDKANLKRFTEYVHSPYFKVPSSSVALFNYLASLHPKFDEKKFTPTQIAKKVRDLPSENKQAKAGSELIKALERFLATERIHASERAWLIESLWQQNELHWDALAADNLEKLYKKLESDKDKNIDYFYDKHIATTIEKNGFNAKMIRNHNNDISPVVKTLDEYYAIKKLRYHCELLSRSTIFGTTYNKENIEDLLTILKPYNYPAYAYAFIFINMYQLFSAITHEGGHESYLKLKKYITDIDKGEMTQSAKECIDYLISYNLNWFNKGNTEAGRESLWCIEIKIKHAFLLERGKIQPITFRNTVSLAVLTGKEPAWIKKFIDTYSLYLHEENASTELAFAKGLYHYYIKEYEKAMPLYQQAQVKEEPVFNLSVRRWQFMCMYEKNIGDTGVLIDYLNAFEQYIKRNAEALHHVKPLFSRFISYCKKLLSITDKEEIVTILKQLEAEAHFAGKQWIKQQFDIKIKNIRK